MHRTFLAVLVQRLVKGEVYAWFQRLVGTEHGKVPAAVTHQFREAVAPAGIELVCALPLGDGLMSSGYSPVVAMAKNFGSIEALAAPVPDGPRLDILMSAAAMRGKAMNAAELFEIDDVIDPADTRAWVTAGLRALPPKTKREGKKRGWVDTW